MLPDDTRKKIKNITAGIIIDGVRDTCTTIRNFLSASFATSTTVKTDFEGKSIIKEEQAILLEKYSNEYNLWVTDLPGEDRFLIRGEEAQSVSIMMAKMLLKLKSCAIKKSIWKKSFSVFTLHPLFCDELNRLIKVSRRVSKGISPLSRRVKEFAQSHYISLRAIFRLIQQTTFNSTTH